MPANLTPQYYAAEEAFRRATAVEEKIEALQEMLAVIPKHKGTEKLQGDLKRRLSKLREEGQKRARAGSYNPFYVEKQGAGQVVLAGYPNTGKSALVAALTRARVKVAAYPFTTVIPAAGMMPYEEVLIQMVDTPPLTPEGLPAGLLNTLRGADLLLLLIDTGSADCLEQLEGLLSVLMEKKVIRNHNRAGEIGPGDPREPDEGTRLPYLVAASKMDHPDSAENLKIIRELMPDLPLNPISIVENNSLDALRRAIFRALDIIRIFTKAPGKPPAMDTPFVLKKGSTVLDLASSIHRDFPQMLKNARVWGSSRFDGQAVSRDYVLADKDIVELNV